MKLISVLLSVVALLAFAVFSVSFADHDPLGGYQTLAVVGSMTTMAALLVTLAAFTEGSMRDKLLLHAGFLLAPCIVAGVAIWQPFGLSWFTVVLVLTVPVTIGLAFGTSDAYPQYRNGHLLGSGIALLAGTMFILSVHEGLLQRMIVLPAMLFALAWLSLELARRERSGRSGDRVDRRYPSATPWNADAEHQ